MRSTSTQRPRISCKPSPPASSSLISAALSRSPSSVTSMLKSSSASLPSSEGGRAPTLALTSGRAGRPACQVPGARTTMPAASSLRHVGEEAGRRRPASSAADDRSRRRPPSSRSQPHCSAARCTGISSESSRAWLLPSGELGQRLRQRQMLRLAMRRQARGVGGEKGERRFRVLAIFRQIEMHPADQIPGRMTRLEKILQRVASMRPARRARRHRARAHSAASTSAVRYSAPVIGGASAIKSIECRVVGMWPSRRPPAWRTAPSHSARRNRATRPSRRQNAADFGRAEMQQAMPGSQGRRHRRDAAEARPARRARRNPAPATDGPAASAAARGSRWR